MADAGDVLDHFSREKEPELSSEVLLPTDGRRPDLIESDAIVGMNSLEKLRIRRLCLSWIESEDRQGLLRRECSPLSTLKYQLPVWLSLCASAM